MREGEKENRQRSRRTVCASLRNPAAYSLCFLSLIKVILQHNHGYEATANMHVPNRHTDVCVCVSAAVQCEVCTQTPQACDCQSYDSFENS